MKKIEAIIRPTKISDVCDALGKVGHPGITITEIEGHGQQQGVQQQFHGKTYNIEFLTKTKIEIVVRDQDAAKIIKAIREAAFTGKVGDGKIFITPIENALRIRTAEQGELALG